MSRAARFLVFSLILTTRLAGQVPPAPIAPADLPEPRSPQWGAELTRGPGAADAPLGVGHLRPTDAAPNAGHEWLRDALIPLYRGPGGPHWGWLAHGWLLSPDHAKRPFPAACLLETGYESSSIIITEWRADGWFRLAVDPPCAARGDSFWSHRTLLDLAAHELTAELWETFFFRDDISPLWFRREIRHALRAGPGPENERIAWIGSDHSITPLEVAGDWMRIRVFQPSNYCVGPGEWRGRKHEGWIQWRDQEKGPWLFFWSRGC